MVEKMTIRDWLAVPFFMLGIGLLMISIAIGGQEHTERVLFSLGKMGEPDDKAE